MLWLSETRYMHAQLTRDLFGSWEVTIARGGRHNRLGRIYAVPVSDEQAGRQYLAALHKRRTRHGYHLVEPKT